MDADEGDGYLMRHVEELGHITLDWSGAARAPPPNLPTSANRPPPPSGGVRRKAVSAADNTAMWWARGSAGPPTGCRNCPRGLWSRPAGRRNRLRGRRSRPRFRRSGAAHVSAEPSTEPRGPPSTPPLRPCTTAALAVSCRAGDGEPPPSRSLGATARRSVEPPNGSAESPEPGRRPWRRLRAPRRGLHAPGACCWDQSPLPGPRRGRACLGPAAGARRRPPWSAGPAPPPEGGLRRDLHLPQHPHDRTFPLAPPCHV